MGKEWAKVRLSFVLSFLAVLLLLPVCAYLGYSAGAKINYTYLRSKSFSSLGRQNSQELRHLGETAYAFELSQILLRSPEASFQQNISIVQELRPKAPHELWPIVDLRIAQDHAVIARLEQQANNPAEAARHHQLAQDLLRSLGWGDVSENLLNKMADKQLRARFKR